MKKLLLLRAVALSVCTFLFTFFTLQAQPTLVSVTPFGDLYGTYYDYGNIVITFSEAMDEMTVGTVQLNSLPALTGGSWSAGSTVFTIPYSGLSGGTYYTVNISGFKNTSGIAMAPDGTHWFQTEPWESCPGTLPPPTVVRSVVYYEQGGGLVDISSDVGASMSVACDYIFWRDAGTSPTDPGSLTTTPSLNKSIAGTYYFWVTQVQSSPGACGSIQITVIIGSVPLPKVHETSVCQGQTLTVNLATLVEPNPDPFTYELVWYTSPSGTGSLTPPDPASIDTSVAGEQFVYVTYREAFNPTNESIKEPIKITVYPIPTAGITNNTGSTVLTCTNSSISLTATGDGTYSWSNSLGSNANVTITTPGTYTVTVMGAGSCTDAASITITEDKTPPSAGITNNTGTTILTCTTPSISLTATDGVSYAWNNSLGSNANVTVTAPGTYTVTVTGANGCTNTASITITEDKASPTLLLSASPASPATYGNNITLAATLAGGCAPTGNITFIVNGSNADVQTVTGNGVYTYTMPSPNLGVYEFEVTYSGDAYNNSALATKVTGYTIIPAPVTVTARGGSSVYGENPVNPGFYATGLLGGDDESALTGLYVDFYINDTTPRGWHTLKVEGNTTNPNYTIITRVTGTWVVSQAPGIFINIPDIYVTYTPAFTLEGIALPDHYRWYSPLIQPNAGNNQKFPAVYEDPSGNYSSVRGEVTVHVARAAGADVSGPPVLDGFPTENSISVKALTIPVNPGNQTVEYASSTSNPLTTFALNALAWQPGLTFTGLFDDTAYYIYARSAANLNYNAGLAQVSEIIRTVRITGIGEVVETGEFGAWIYDGTLYLDGLTAGKTWSIYNIFGALIYRDLTPGPSPHGDNLTPGPSPHGEGSTVMRSVASIGMTRGIYIVQSEEKAVKVIN